MFSFLKPKSNSNQTEVVIQLSGLHCTSCATNIDLTLEDLPGIANSTTNYAKMTSNIIFDPSKVTLKKIHQTIQELGYQII